MSHYLMLETAPPFNLTETSYRIRADSIDWIAQLDNNKTEISVNGTILTVMEPAHVILTYIKDPNAPLQGQGDYEYNPGDEPFIRKYGRREGTRRYFEFMHWPYPKSHLPVPVTIKLPHYIILTTLPHHQENKCTYYVRTDRIDWMTKRFDHTAVSVNGSELRVWEPPPVILDYITDPNSGLQHESTWKRSLDLSEYIRMYGKEEGIKRFYKRMHCPPPTVSNHEKKKNGRHAAS